ncbi:Monocopper oxidase-like protein SKS1 [Hibiscus syriacus]|uniref:Monocopper oxidase-like protein SKS1 n=1 Tax=Hibiscus syriacus TaxID=106335 RepID=A0A6A2XCS7_HIBSY|nr:Monocopper oxidase-like protein SKS1 [Hibiscus syriacus]
MPDGDITIFISDWYTKSHKISLVEKRGLRKDVEIGVGLGVPDGILINGFGPYRYYQALVKDGIVYQIINVEPGKTYCFRVHNVGISTSLDFRIQGHNLLPVETEGSNTVQQNYSNMDIHVGQLFSFLVTMDQNASSAYYIVASPRFVNSSDSAKFNGVSILHYSNSQGPASGPLPDPPNDYDTYFSMNQARLIRWKVSAGAAHPNPQGSFKYGEITVTDVYVILNRPAEHIDGKRHTTLNGISYLPLSTPFKLAQQFKIPGMVFHALLPCLSWSLDSNLVSLDNAGIWNLRAQDLDSWYLGQEAYVSVVNPEVNQSEAPLPENSIYCGILSSLQKDQAQIVNFSGGTSISNSSKTIFFMLIIVALIGHSFR